MRKGEKLYYYFLEKYGTNIGVEKIPGRILDLEGMKETIHKLYMISDEEFDEILMDKQE